MYQLETQASFDSAHFLAGYNGKCANIHGHRWTVKVTVAAENLIESGEKRSMVIDFGDLKRSVRALADSYDHALIIERGSLREKTLRALCEEGFRLIELPYRPTAENFSRAFFEALRSEGLPVTSVAVYETPDNCAVYSEV